MQHPNHFNLARIQNLTDGIFAVAMTLLVLDIRLAPGLSRHLLGYGLIALTPRLYSYVVSFFVLALFWWTYHRIVALIARADDALVWWNVVFLFAVTLLPFTAYLLGAFYGTRIATEAYCLNLITLSVLMIVMWRYAERHDLIESQVTGARRRLVSARLVAATATYACTLLLGYWLPYWFWLGFAASVPMRFVARRFAG